MKEGWKTAKLTKVCNIQYGYAFDSKCFTEDNTYMPLIRIRDVVRGYSETFYSGEIPDGYFIEKGDYLIGMDGEFNIGVWNSSTALLNQRVCKISSSSEYLLNQYMLYFMRVCLKKIEDETPFVTVKHLSAKRLNQVEITLPSISEQQQIVEELDLLSGIIEKKKEQLRELDNLAQSIFYEMFGDPVANEKGFPTSTVGENVTDVKYGTSRPACENGKFKYLRMGNLTLNGHLDLTDLKLIDIPDNEIEKCIVRRGDILFNRTNSLELIGKTCMFDLDEPMVIAGYIIRVRFNEFVNPRFISVLFNMPEYKKLLKGMAKGAVNQANINSKELQSIRIILPPLSLQQSFASKIEAIEKEKALIKQSITETETLFNSRMDYYFG